jgi:hypothetical protein
MEKGHLSIVFKLIFVAIVLLFSTNIVAQSSTFTTNSQNAFWQNVQFGGGIGLGFGSGFTDINVAPSAIYNLNRFVSLGTSLQFGYVSSKNNFTSVIYGGSLIGLINPIPEIQLSAEIEEINVNTSYKNFGSNSTNFWNTSLYIGAGYRTGNVTVGGRYDVLYNANKSIYNNPFMPFVRVYF